MHTSTCAVRPRRWLLPETEPDSSLSPRPSPALWCRARRAGGPSRRGTCWVPRTEPFRRRGSDSWPSVGTRIEEVVASHASMVSQPEIVTRLILSAVEATSRTLP
jgi:hypothetical protein